MEIVLVNLWEGVDARGEAQRFRELWGIEGPVLVDEDGALAARLGVRGVPTNVFVDADGTVTTVGAVTPDDLEAATRRLLGPGADIDPPATKQWHWEKDTDHIERHIAGFDAFASGDPAGLGAPEDVAD